MNSLARKPLLFLVGAVLCVPSFGADDREQQVGFVRVPGGSKLVRAGMATPLASRSFDFLYSGDRMVTSDLPATLTFCPSQESLTLAPASEIRFEPKQVRVTRGKVTDRKPVDSCLLPQVIRVATASQQHYGSGITRGVPSDYPPVPYAQLPADVKAELQHSLDLLAADPSDVYPHIVAAAVYEKHNLPANALAEYRALLKPLPGIEWVGQKIFELESALDTAAAKAATPPPGGKTYALLVGVSEYEDKTIPALNFADADADLLNSFVRTERGGKAADEDVLVLKNKKATAAAVTEGFNVFLKKAGKNDTIVILIAGHGIADASKSVYFATNESNHEDLRSTALALADLTKLFGAQLDHVGRILIFVDICKAGTIEKYNNSLLDTILQTNLTSGEVPQDNMLVFMASYAGKSSLEYRELGHGVFSYFVQKGLNGDADTDNDGFVEVGEFTSWVTGKVFDYTQRKQKPKDFGNLDFTKRIVDLSKPGDKTAHRPVLLDNRNGGPLYLASASPDPLPFDEQADASLKRFESALTAGRLLHGSDSAFDALEGLKGQLSEDRFVLARNRLRVALEDAAQRVLLRYLAGEQPSPPPKNYTDAAQYLSAALKLDPGSMFLEGRKNFFDGRAMLFDKTKSPDAAILLESSIRIDPQAGYAFNALGIAYLEQSEFKKAIPAFQDAIRRAPHWAYPLHNLALAYTAIGDYGAAIRAYRDAIRLTPQYGYLPYNLGLVYQRVNRRKEAEASYRQAIAVDPALAAPYNNLGSLKALEGKRARADAEGFYCQALERNPRFLEARHNLALLLASDKSRLAEALSLWRKNLEQDRDYVPSHLSLAQTLAAGGDNKAAIEEYRRVLELKPAYIAARLELARLLAASGDTGTALIELQEAARRDATNAAIFERIGDLEAGRHRSSGAAAAYNSALKLAPDRAARKRLKKKLNLLPPP